MLNKVILMGRLTKDPETRETQNGKKMLKFSVAVDDGYGDKKHTSFINCIAFEKRAEFIEKYFGKGNMIALVGSIRTDKYDDKDGRTVYTTDVFVDEASFTGEKKDDRVQPGRPPVSGSAPDLGDEFEDFDPSGVPF